MKKVVERTEAILVAINKLTHTPIQTHIHEYTRYKHNRHFIMQHKRDGQLAAECGTNKHTNTYAYAAQIRHNGICMYVRLARTTVPTNEPNSQRTTPKVDTATNCCKQQIGR